MSPEEKYANLEGWISFGMVMAAANIPFKKFTSQMINMGEDRLKSSQSTSTEQVWQDFVETLKGIEKNT